MHLANLNWSTAFLNKLEICTVMAKDPKRRGAKAIWNEDGGELCPSNNLGAYSLGTYNLGAYIWQPDWDPSIHSPLLIGTYNLSTIGAYNLRAYNLGPTICDLESGGLQSGGLYWATSFGCHSLGACILATLGNQIRICQR